MSVHSLTAWLVLCLGFLACGSRQEEFNEILVTEPVLPPGAVVTGTITVVTDDASKVKLACGSSGTGQCSDTIPFAACADGSLLANVSQMYCTVYDVTPDNCLNCGYCYTWLCFSSPSAVMTSVSQETSVDSTNPKQLQVACPAGYLATGAGWSVLDSTGAFLDGEVDANLPLFDLSGWLVNAKNQSTFTQNWKLKVTVICALGVNTEAASPSSQSSPAAPPAGGLDPG